MIGECPRCKCKAVLHEVWFMEGSECRTKQLACQDCILDTISDEQRAHDALWKQHKQGATS